MKMGFNDDYAGAKLQRKTARKKLRRREKNWRRMGQIVGILLMVAVLIATLAVTNDEPCVHAAGSAKTEQLYVINTEGDTVLMGARIISE